MCAEEKGKEMILANTNVYLKTWRPFVFINYSVIIEINSLLCCNTSYVIKNSVCVGMPAHICYIKMLMWVHMHMYELIHGCQKSKRSVFLNRPPPSFSL